MRATRPGLLLYIKAVNKEQSSQERGEKNPERGIWIWTTFGSQDVTVASIALKKIHSQLLILQLTGRKEIKDQGTDLELLVSQDNKTTPGTEGKKKKKRLTNNFHFL